MNTRTILGIFALASTFGCSGMCASTQPDPPSQMHLTSPAFGEGELIPQRFTCDGDDVSPRLDYGAVPEGAQALALIVDDPDAPRGTWVHWVYYGVAAEDGAVAEGDGAPLPGDGTGPRHGRNDFTNLGYGGPCPPPGPAHRYYFKLYALDAPVGLPEGATKTELLEAMEDHIVDEAQLVGRYARAE